MIQFYNHLRGRSSEKKTRLWAQRYQVLKALTHTKFITYIQIYLYVAHICTYASISTDLCNLHGLLKAASDWELVSKLKPCTYTQVRVSIDTHIYIYIYMSTAASQRVEE